MEWKHTFSTIPTSDRPSGCVSRASARNVSLRALCLGVVLCLCSVCPAAQGAFDGDPELLQTLVALRKDNCGKISTWQGKALIQRAGNGPEIAFVDKEEVQFWLDEAAQAYRWRQSVVETRRGMSGSLADVARELETKSGMRKKDGVYELEPGVRKVGNAEWENALVIWPSDFAKQRQEDKPDFFDPMRYLQTWEGMEIESMLASGYEAAQKDVKGQRSVERRGQEILYSVTLDGITWRYTFDMSKGGNLVAAEVTRKGNHSEYKYEFTLIDGVWMPKACKSRNEGTLDTGEKSSSERSVQFVENEINKTIPPSTFTLRALGVQQGCYVSDHRIGCVYYYGGDTPEALPELLRGATEGSMLPKASADDKARAASGVAGTGVTVKNPSGDPGDTPATPSWTGKAGVSWVYVGGASLLAVAIAAVAVVVGRRSRRKERV